MFKKVALFLGLFLMAGLAKAGLWDDIPERYTVVYTSSPAGVSVSTTIVMVSLSSNTWPHIDSNLSAREIIIDSIQVDMDKAAATTATVKVGVIREINASSGTVVYFETVGNALNVSNTNNMQYIVYPDGGLNCRVNPRSPNFGASLGSTPFLFSNDATTSTSLTTSLPLPSVAGGIITFPRQGDIVATVTTGAAASNFSIIVRYRTGSK